MPSWDSFQPNRFSEPNLLKKDYNKTHLEQLEDVAAAWLCAMLSTQLHILLISRSTSLLLCQRPLFVPRRLLIKGRLKECVPTTIGATSCALGVKSSESSLVILNSSTPDLTVLVSSVCSPTVRDCPLMVYHHFHSAPVEGNLWWPNQLYTRIFHWAPFEGSLWWLNQ